MINSIPLMSLTLILVAVVTCQHSICRSLQWVPVYRKKVFTTILNHVDCPTWSTRNVTTKMPTSYASLLLPKGIPFAFLCGACFSPWSIDANITAHSDNGLPLTLVPVKRTPNIYEHKKDDYTVCLISYGLTAPLSKGGRITCRLNRGIKVYDENLHYSVQRTSVEEEEEKAIEVSSNGMARLQCPEDSSLAKTVHVWYSPEKADSPSGATSFLVPTLRHEIDFRPKEKEQHVACAVYDVTKPSTVLIRSYKVVSTDDQVRSGHWVVDDHEVDPQNPNTGTSMKGILLVAGLLVAGICVTSILVCASFGLCKCNRKRTNDPPPQEPNRLSLLESPTYEEKRYGP